jgi:hypothetical protein
MNRREREAIVRMVHQYVADTCGHVDGRFRVMAGALGRYVYHYWDDGLIERRDTYLIWDGPVLEDAVRRYRGDARWTRLN